MTEGNRGETLLKAAVKKSCAAKAVNKAADRPKAIAHAQDALKILEGLKLPEAKEVRRLLGDWRKESDRTIWQAPRR